MKASTLIIGGLVLAGVGTALFFMLKKSGEKSKKEFILSVFKDKTEESKVNLSDALSKMSSQELNLMNEFALLTSEAKEVSDDLDKKVREVLTKYNLPV
jgi:hypothetical protein